MAASDTMVTLAMVGGLAVGAYIFKDQIMGFIDELKGETTATAPVPVPAETETEEEGGADPELSSRTIAIDYYAGRVAQSVTKVAARNIYNWEEIKNVIIEKYVADVTVIAEANKFEQKAIDENNMTSMRAYARLVLKVCQQMSITVKPEEKKALEEVGGIGITPTIPKSTQERRHFYDWTKVIINVTPPVTVTTVNPVVYYKVRDLQLKRGWKPKRAMPKKVVFRNWKDLDKWYLIRYGHQRPTATTLPPGCTISANGIITCVQSSLAFTVPEEDIRFTMS